MKPKRQAKILELIRSSEIETQGELTRQLSQAGFEVAQATVSRDMHEMKLTKVPTLRGTHKYALPPHQDEAMLERFKRVLREGFVSMDYAGNLLVIRTLHGMAMAVAAALDAMRLPQVVGSIAGDDVVMCAVKSEADAVALMEQLKKVV